MGAVQPHGKEESLLQTPDPSRGQRESSWVSLPQTKNAEDLPGTLAIVVLPGRWLQPHQTHPRHGMGCPARRDARGLPKAGPGCVEAASNLGIAPGEPEVLVAHPGTLAKALAETAQTHL